MKRVIEFLEKHRKFAVLTHLNPDGDALGSAYALARSLNNLGKSAEVILLCEPPSKYRFSQFDSLYRLLEETGKCSYDAAVAVDCATIGRLSSAQEFFRESAELQYRPSISNTQYAQVNYVENVAATGELIWRIAEQLGAKADDGAYGNIYGDFD